MLGTLGHDNGLFNIFLILSGDVNWGEGEGEGDGDGAGAGT